MGLGTTSQLMVKQILPLLISQFLSAFADNAILFSVIALVMHSQDLSAWYVPALQGVFLVAFVALGPWVGGFADYHAKARVLLIANLLKASGAVLLLCQVEPLLSYCVVGAGAALYSPAKYGILPELTHHEFLVKANSYIEGSTICAILLGMVAGAAVGDFSTTLAFACVIVLYLFSALLTLLLPVRISKIERPSSQFSEFGKEISLFLITRRTRFVILGASLFWASAATLRVIIIAWAPVALLTKNATDVAQITLYLAIGIIAGAAVVPGVIPLEHLRRVRFAAYLMACFIGLLSFTTGLFEARCALLGIGMMGGMVIVPLNASIQELGKASIGSGSAVAIQNFFQNLAQLLAVAAYTYASANHASPVSAMQALGACLFSMTLLISMSLPRNVREQAA